MLTQLLTMTPPKLACVVVLGLASVVAALSAGEELVLPGDSVVYVGAVLEYEAYNQWSDEEGGEGITLENARRISKFAYKAKYQGVDILIAPEYGIQSLIMKRLTPEQQFTLTLYVPDPSLQETPCALSFDGSNFEALKLLSCAAAASDLYLVVDLAEASPCSPEAAAQSPFDNVLDTAYECPESGHILYNTQVVFDRSGTVIARYRKMNLYLEHMFNPGTESDEEAIFVTDFGVAFTLQVCFDMVHEHPGLMNVVNRGVKDVAMSTAWIDFLPFYTAISMQNGWSRGLGINLLVSGFHLPEYAKMGSGIYRGFSDLHQEYVYDPDSGNRMIVSEVETIAATDGIRNPKSKLDSVEGARLAKDDTVSVDKQPRRDHLLYYMDLSNFTHVPLARSASWKPKMVKLCHNDGLCCSLTYTSTSILNYSLFAFSGSMPGNDGVHSQFWQICAVVWCKTGDINTCSHISDGLPPDDKFGAFTISGNYIAGHVFPVFFDRNLALVKNDLYSVTVDGNVHTLAMPQKTPNLLNAGLLAHLYDRDTYKDSSDTLLKSVF